MKAASNERSRIVVYRRNPGDPLTAAQRKNLAELAARPDRPIDTSDIPELPAAAWKNAIRGRFYRPTKQAVSLRLDADIVARLKKIRPRLPNPRQPNPPPPHAQRPSASLIRLIHAEPVVRRTQKKPSLSPAPLRRLRR